jgi:hypothetical protein
MVFMLEITLTPYKLPVIGESMTTSLETRGDPFHKFEF